ncbi:unnamed protein product [Fusarium graminearum]|uniref:Uncharacterized protein n=1 Tax=Gibberella zeae TaxID=5518 RepID=A0A4E9EI99_GIBZA|nr:unnamed protein product [Fusarium graminearum]
MYSYHLVLVAGGSLLVSSYVPVPPCSHRQCYRWVARKTGMMSPWGSRRYACAPEHVNFLIHDILMPILEPTLDSDKDRDRKNETDVGIASFLVVENMTSWIAHSNVKLARALTRSISPRAAD